MSWTSIIDVSLIVLVVFAWYRLGVKSGRKQEREAVQPKLDTIINRAHEVELIAVIWYAEAFLVEEHERHGKFSLTLYRFIRELETKEHRK